MTNIEIYVNRQAPVLLMGETNAAGNAAVKRDLEPTMHGSLAGGDTHRPEFPDLGELSDLGVVPKKMRAFCARKNSICASKAPWRPEIVDAPNAGPGEVLDLRKATRIYIDDVRAALGYRVGLITAGQLMREKEHPRGDVACMDYATNKFRGEFCASSFRGEKCDRMKAEC
ncbi:MAG: hypothetical protein OXI01_06640 [Albidovulum sp.]|nr:hypothetical protein [Albidovulum sp.]